MPGKSGRKTKEQQRASNIRRYGLTVAEYNRLLLEQQNVCFICKKTNKQKMLGVDHDHKTGQVRGLLCDLCNRALGLLHDDISLLRRAIGYLHQGGASWLRGKLVSKYSYSHKMLYRQVDDKIINKYADLPHNVALRLEDHYQNE